MESREKSVVYLNLTEGEWVKGGGGQGMEVFRWTGGMDVLVRFVKLRDL